MLIENERQMRQKRKKSIQNVSKLLTFRYSFDTIISERIRNMKEIGIVRLESLKITNFKNIENGEIYFSENKKVQRGEIDEDDFKNILGIYGQNGSGKTSWR